MGPKVRLDHDYCIFMNEGGQSGRLHGGPEVVGDHWYKYWDGVMRNGLSVITYFLTDAAEGDGGFACVPGSHKTNFLSNLPDDIRNYETSCTLRRSTGSRGGGCAVLHRGTHPRDNAVACQT